jgi:phosphoglycerate dehydrogenase-like enzyme
MKIFVDMALPADALEALKAGAVGHELLFPRTPATSVLAKGDTDPLFFTADIVFGQPDPAAVDRSTLLKWIHVSSSGITRYDNAGFRSLVTGRGIAVSNSAAVFADACAVHVFSFIVAQARNLPAALRTRTPNGTAAWNELRRGSSTLAGESVLILGYGSIGKRLAELLKPLGMEVVGFRRRLRGDEPIPMVTENGLAEAMGRAQHIVNILPDNAGSRGFFDAERFESLSNGAVFYNIGRGVTVDQTALLGALRSGRLKAAWLDVTDPEPLPDDHPLWQQPNCFITPHTAGGQGAEFDVLVRHFIDNLKRFVAGQPLADRVM